MSAADVAVGVPSALDVAFEDPDTPEFGKAFVAPVLTRSAPHPVDLATVTRAFAGAAWQPCGLSRRTAFL